MTIIDIYEGQEKQMKTCILASVLPAPKCEYLRLVGSRRTSFALHCTCSKIEIAFLFRAKME
jgi:hypothetical protein